MESCESDLGGGWGYSVYVTTGRKLRGEELFGGGRGGVEVVETHRLMMMGELCC